MIEQVTKLRTHPSILSWYQSDEPDGKSNPLNSTGIAYDILKELDPYHPISLALNCYDFYYADYAAGADIIAPGTRTTFHLSEFICMPSHVLTTRSHKRCLSHLYEYLVLHGVRYRLQRHLWLLRL